MYEHDSRGLRRGHHVAARLAGPQFFPTEKTRVGFRHGDFRVVTYGKGCLVQQRIALGAVPIKASDFAVPAFAPGKMREGVLGGKGGYSLQDLDDLDCNFDRSLSATLEIVNWHLGYSKRCLCKEALGSLPVPCGVVRFSTSLTHLSRKVVDDSDWLPRLVVPLHGYELRPGFSRLAKNALHRCFLLQRRYATTGSVTGIRLGILGTRVRGLPSTPALPAPRSSILPLPVLHSW